MDVALSSWVFFFSYWVSWWSAEEVSIMLYIYAQSYSFPIKISCCFHLPLPSPIYLLIFATSSLFLSSYPNLGILLKCYKLLFNSLKACILNFLQFIAQMLPFPQACLTTIENCPLLSSFSITSPLYPDFLIVKYISFNTTYKIRILYLTCFTICWRRKWQPTPVFLPGESQGQRSLVGCRLWGRTESDTTEATQQQQQQHYMLSTLFFNSL